MRVGAGVGESVSVGVGVCGGGGVGCGCVSVGCRQCGTWPVHVQGALFACWRCLCSCAECVQQRFVQVALNAHSLKLGAGRLQCATTIVLRTFPSACTSVRSTLL